MCSLQHPATGGQIRFPRWSEVRPAAIDGQPLHLESEESGICLWECRRARKHIPTGIGWGWTCRIASDSDSPRSGVGRTSRFTRTPATHRFMRMIGQVKGHAGGRTAQHGRTENTTMESTGTVRTANDRRYAALGRHVVSVRVSLMAGPIRSSLHKGSREAVRRAVDQVGRIGRKLG